MILFIVCWLSRCPVPIFGAAATAVTSSSQEQLRDIVGSGNWSCAEHKGHPVLKWAGAAPALDNGQLRVALRGRWVFMVGDSSLRMWYDYIVARLAGDWEGREWDTHWNNFGPTRDNARCQDQMIGCNYDAWVAGVRVTFVWNTWASSRREAVAEVEKLVDQSTGGPDVLLVDDGPWEKKMRFVWGADQVAFLDDIERALAPRMNTWPRWPSPPPLKLFCNMNCCDNLKQNPASDWLAASAHHVSQRAQNNWELFDRAAVVRRAREEAPDCHGVYSAACHFGADHPTGEILAVMVDILAAVVADIGTGATA